MDDFDSGASEDGQRTVLPYATPAPLDDSAVARRHDLMGIIAAVAIIGNICVCSSGGMELSQAWLLVATDVVIGIGVPISLAAVKPGGIRAGVGFLFTFGFLILAMLLALLLSVMR